MSEEVYHGETSSLNTPVWEGGDSIEDLLGRKPEGREGGKGENGTGVKPEARLPENITGVGGGGGIRGRGMKRNEGAKGVESSRAGSPRDFLKGRELSSKKCCKSWTESIQGKERERRCSEPVPITKEGRAPHINEHHREHKDGGRPNY